MEVEMNLNYYPHTKILYRAFLVVNYAIYNGWCHFHTEVHNSVIWRLVIPSP